MVEKLLATTLEQTIQAVPAMTVADRLRLADEIWDSLHDTDIPPLTSGQRAELDRRMADHETNPATALSNAEVGAQLADLR